MPRISVVLPTYNGENYIKKSIESIISQTFTDWELIIVDDCSTDSTYEIAKYYSEMDLRIRVIRNKVNSKTPTALNNGFNIAKGDYLTWTSDDNIYLNDAFECMSVYLDEHPECGLVYCDMEYINENDCPISWGNRKYNPDKLYWKCVIGACFLYRNQVLKTVGGYSAENFLVEDYDYFLRVSKYFEIHRIPEIKYKLRIHPGAQTCTKAKQYEDCLYRLRIRELDYLLSRIKEEDKLILALYLYFKEGDLDVQTKIWGSNLPGVITKLVARKRFIDSNKKYIIMGAGLCGNLTLNILGKENVECFVDNNENKVGQKNAGIIIRDYDFLLKHRDEYNIVVAIGAEIIEQIVNQLYQSEVNEYITYFELINENYGILS